MIITIDGPAGSGKSTTARNVAHALGIAFLDTGATYRAVTLKALEDLDDLTDEAGLVEAAQAADIRLIPVADGVRVRLDGRDVTREIRSPRVTDSAHHVAGCPAVRTVLVDLQRRIAEDLGDCVSEGRDQGTVVFPRADHKFFLEAQPEVRARRRHEELVRSGEDVTFEQVLSAQTQRDHRDRTRRTAPLVKPPDAVEIDTSDLSPDEVVRKILSHVREGDG